MKSKVQKPKNGRRKFLKGVAGVSAFAAGSQIIGAPMVWANKLKDIKLSHVGGAYSAMKPIAEQASKDLGFTIEMQNLGFEALTARVATQPKTIDIADLSFVSMPAVTPRGVMQGIDISRIKNWDKITPIFTQGKNQDGSTASTQGNAPYEMMYLEKMDSKAWHEGPTEHASLIPTIYNADTLGIRPDIIARPIENWSELFNPEFKGKAGIVDTPAVGIMDAAMALESRGDLIYGDKGNMTIEEIDKTMDVLIDLKKQGHFRSLWNTFDASVNLMVAGEVVIQSMWSPAVTAVRSRGVDCTFVALKEGYRGWGNGIGMMAHLDGLQRDAAYEYINWYLDGWQGAFIARQGYYSAVPETTKAALSQEEWDYWYEGKKATVDIKGPNGNLQEKAGHVRDGGSYWDRMGKVACWNAIHDENRHLTKRWNEFIAA
ncbi:MAG: ABC transporter substrate-binding protein [Blastopirellula sp.]|nr:MAG: ABC transporter substrate-binding protein [Blastopirellula sp.]